MEASMKMEDGEEMKLVIWDTAGQERFQSIALSSIKNSQGIIVVFDVTSKKSFNNVLRWLEQINEKTNNVVIVLFGNKCDMEERKVSREDAEKLAKEHNLSYFETSAKTKMNIYEGFSKVANEAYVKFGNNKTGIDLDEVDKQGGKGCCGKEKTRHNSKKNLNK